MLREEYKLLKTGTEWLLSFNMGLTISSCYFFMKRKIFLIVSIAVMSLRLLSQSGIPEIVLQKAVALIDKQPAVWHIQQGVYSLEYSEEGQFKIVGWNGIGEELFAEQQIESSGLPVLACSYIIKNYPQIKIARVFLRRENKRGNILFHVEVSEVDLFFDELGNYTGGSMKAKRKIIAA